MNLKVSNFLYIFRFLIDTCAIHIFHYYTSSAYMDEIGSFIILLLISRAVQKKANKNVKIGRQKARKTSKIRP